jgi:serine beta-lactamase-like protein LACTB
LRFTPFASFFLCFAGFLIASDTSYAQPKNMDITAAVNQLELLIDREIKAGNITGVSIALIDDQQVLFARGYGLSDRLERKPATSDSIYRAGSISKLFNAVAAMQLAERGKFDIDKPVSDYATVFSIVNPFDKPVTARQIMCHRSGMIRESPRGSYFDDQQVGIEATVKSVSPCVLVYPPDTKTKYSNLAPTIVGRAVEEISGLDYEGYQQKHVLGPLKMTSSAFLMNEKLRPRLSMAYMPVADGKGGYHEIQAPAFELGTLPAGNLYSTAPDLARFVMCLFNGGKAGDEQVLRPETIEQMFTPQLVKEEKGFGIGFSIGAFGRHKTASHMGAVYGFTSALTMIPRHKLGVIVLNNDDVAIGPVRLINNTALSLLLKAKLGEEPPAPAKTIDLPREGLTRLVGEYESESHWATISLKGDVLEANIAGQKNSLRPVEPLKFEAYGRQLYDQFFEFQRDEAGVVIGFTAMQQKFTRVDLSKAVPIPEAWKQYLGSYGPAFIPLIVTVRNGRLYAMTENLYDYRLTPLNQTVFKMCPGMYTDEQLVFEKDASGKVFGVTLATMPLKRR